MAIEKGEVARFFIGLYMVYIFVRNDGYLPIKGVIVFVLLLFAALTPTYIVFVGYTNVFSAAAQVFSRIFTGQMVEAYHYLEYFPSVHDFLMGRSFPNLGGLLPFEQFRLTTEIWAWTLPWKAAIGSKVGSAPTIYWGEMYANFGLLGVLIPPFFVGYILYLINTIVFRLQPNPMSISLTVWLMLYYHRLSSTGMVKYFFDNYFLLFLIIIAIFAFINGRGMIPLLPKTRKK